MESETVVVSVFELFPSFVSANALAGSTVATKVRSGGAPACTVAFTVMIVDPLAGKSPVQVTTLVAWLQLKPFVPEAPTNVMPVGGRLMRMTAPFAVDVPAL